MVILSLLATTDDPTPITIGMAEFIGGILAGAFSLGVFVYDQFRRTRRSASKDLKDFKLWVYRVISRHNREDDENFGALNDNIHQIMMRNAAKDGQSGVRNFQSVRRRRYLVNDGSRDNAQAEEEPEEQMDYEGGG